MSEDAIDRLDAIAAKRDEEIRRVELRYSDLARRTEAELKAQLLSLSANARLATPGGPGATLAAVRELEWENDRQEREIESLRRALALKDMRARTASSGSSSGSSQHHSGSVYVEGL